MYSANTPRLRELVLSRTKGGVWHTTHPDRFRKILESGAILPEPDLPVLEKSGLTYARSLGGVSLFDFEGFEPVSYSEKHKNSHWGVFVPIYTNWDKATWIEIDPLLIAENLVRRHELRERWLRDETYYNFLPNLEAVHIGPLPRTAFKSAFEVNCESDTLVDFPLP